MILDTDIKIQEDVLPITPELLESCSNFKKHNIRTWTYISKSGVKIVFSLSHAKSDSSNNGFWYTRVNIPLWKTIETTSFTKLIDACECAVEIYEHISVTDYDTVPTKKEMIEILSKYNLSC